MTENMQKFVQGANQLIRMIDQPNDAMQKKVGAFLDQNCKYNDPAFLDNLINEPTIKKVEEEFVTRCILRFLCDDALMYQEHFDAIKNGVSFANTKLCRSDVVVSRDILPSIHKYIRRRSEWVDTETSQAHTKTVNIAERATDHRHEAASLSNHLISLVKMVDKKGFLLAAIAGVESKDDAKCFLTLLLEDCTDLNSNECTLVVARLLSRSRKICKEICDLDHVVELLKSLRRFHLQKPPTLGVIFPKKLSHYFSYWLKLVSDTVVDSTNKDVKKLLKLNDYFSILLERQNHLQQEAVILCQSIKEKHGQDLNVCLKDLDDATSQSEFSKLKNWNYFGPFAQGIAATIRKQVKQESMGMLQNEICARIDDLAFFRSRSDSSWNLQRNMDAPIKKSKKKRSLPETVCGD